MYNSLGSVWRRWDLHIHTPGTKKNDEYEGEDIEKKWEKYYEAIDNYIGNGTDPSKAISVMGITDYVSIENYFKVKKDNNLPPCVKMVLPNIEMRLNLLAEDAPINIHFLFDPEYDDQIEDRFLSKLSFTYGERPYTATKRELIRLGKDISKNGDSEVTDDEVAYRCGASQFLADFQNLQDIFKKDSELREHTIIAIVNSTTDGVSGLSKVFKEGQTSSLRESIYYFVDAIFSATPSDREFFLGGKKEDPSKIVAKYRSLKPCIHGSDAHCLKNIFEPEMQRYCWIKSEPSFEGLKQILYEPEDRVLIQKEYPDKKDPHHVISSITLNGDKFSSEPIYFNPNLTCIIGGKSTGKTLLLRQLAYSIDSQYTLAQEKTAQLRDREFLEKSTVLWKDGSEESRKIIYIPQTFLNRTIDSSEGVSSIGKLIEEVLLQVQVIADAKDTLGYNLSTIRKDVGKNISEYLS